MAPNPETTDPIGGEGKTIEVDETFWGRKEGAEHVDPWQFSNEKGWNKGGMGRPAAPGLPKSPSLPLSSAAARPVRSR